mgnify:CR=1 FL=1
MGGAIACMVSLAIAAFGVEAFKSVPDYGTALLIMWHQSWAIMTYYFIWVRPEIKELKNESK